MKYALYHPKDLSEEQWQIYAALRDARPIYDNPLFDPDFARLVGEVREDTRIGFASDRDGVFAVWPMHLRPGNWARPIGSPFSDRNGPVIAANVELLPEEILSGFELSGFTTHGFLTRATTDASTPGNRCVHAADLSQGWTEFIKDRERFWPKHFEGMALHEECAMRDHAAIRFVWNDTSETAFSRLLELKHARFTRSGYYNALTAPWCRDLLDRLRTFEGRRLRARVSSLRFGNHIVAGAFNLQSDTVLHGWSRGADPDFDAYAPQQLILQHLLRHASDHGVARFEAGTEYEGEMMPYANAQSRVEVGVIAGSSMRVSPARIAGRAWQIGEQIMPAPARAMMARARRQMDRIAAIETTLAGRAGGMFAAIGQRPV